MSETGWEGILEDGEEIIWQGLPDPGFFLKGENILSGIFGLFFAGFAAFWMAMASQAGGVYWMFGLIHFSVGVWMAFWSIFKGTLHRRNTWYTLTNQRAIIATDFPFKDRAIAFFPITVNSKVELQSKGRLNSIFFASATRRAKNKVIDYKVGFERIAVGANVLALLRGIQKGTA